MLSSSAGPLFGYLTNSWTSRQDGSDEDNTRMGVASEDIDSSEVDGNLPITATGIVDIEGVSQPSELHALQHVSLWKSDKAINVLMGNKILSEQNLPLYFTSAFPTIFPWGTCKHIDDRRPNRGSKPTWISNCGCSCSTETHRGTDPKCEFLSLTL
jgi:hypothetical protein